MFTGLVREVGEVGWLRRTEQTVQLLLKAPRTAPRVRTGESVAVNGCCLTVTAHREEQLMFDLLEESLKRTNLGQLKPGSPVNLERALRVDGRLGGHFVQGHIDGKACVVSIQKMESGEERIRFTTDMIGKDLLVSKGSIAIDGVSLTLASVEREFFEVCLIPMTVQETTFGTIQVGQVVNIETDMLTRTVVQIVTRMST